MNLYFDFEFTSLSPDAQPISLGIVSDEIGFKFPESEIVHFEDRKPIYYNFYAEFSDFDINRCDDWVKGNVVDRLTMKEYDKFYPAFPNFKLKGDTEFIKNLLKKWLYQFSDYEIQFIGDCCTWDWYWMLQLIGEWEEKPYQYKIDVSDIPPDLTLEEFVEEMEKCPYLMVDKNANNAFSKADVTKEVKTGLPKLPSNISPVPFDINDLIALKREITPKEAFDLNREKLADRLRNDGSVFNDEQKHNALFDAEVIKEIHQKLK